MKVYLAGPEVFAFEAHQRFAEMRALCEENALTAVTPMDHQMESPSPAEIYKKNLALIQSCALVIANISPFRGIGVDPGTAFEIGYAVALGKPIVAWSNDLRDLMTRTAGAYGGNLRHGTDNKWRDATGDEVENFGLQENLMIAVPAMTDGLSVYRNFSTALKQAVKILNPSN